MNRNIKLPPITLYRRIVTKAKKNRTINVTFKQLNLGRKYEIAEIYNKACLRATDTICDAGCGDGYWSYYFSRKVKRVIAFDPFMVDLKQAQRYSSESLCYLNAVGENIPLSNSTVDKVISVCVFEHCYDDRQVFSEIFRILRPGGKLLATVDSLESPFISEKHRQWHQRTSYCCQLYTRDALKEKLNIAGFQNIKMSYLMGSRLAVWWEIMVERLGVVLTVVGPILYPIILRLEKKDQKSGYKIFVEAQK